MKFPDAGRRRDIIECVSVSSAIADKIASELLSRSDTSGICILDSCGVGPRGRNRFIAASEPSDIFKINSRNPLETLAAIEEVSRLNKPVVFTLSYDFGLKLQGISSRHEPKSSEPDLFCAVYDSALIFDYDSGQLSSCGMESNSVNIWHQIDPDRQRSQNEIPRNLPPESITPVPDGTEYLRQIEEIKELIRDGETYQANLTRKFHIKFRQDFLPGNIFLYGRKHHPAAYSAFIDRGDSSVVSLSPECFFSVRGQKILASPIKGTRRRTADKTSDRDIIEDLSSSEKDRAENIMIVDLLRNDLGRICEFGTVRAESLLEIETLPTLFHLVSHISGKLRGGAGLSDILKALFPCGSITGAPKINTMSILDRLELSPRGLSMGAIGLILPTSKPRRPEIDVSVAIRTLVCQGNLGEFNVGGGIVIDSDPAAEFNETETKATALLASCGVNFPEPDQNTLLNK